MLKPNASIRYVKSIKKNVGNHMNRLLNHAKLRGHFICRSKLKIIPYTCKKLTKTSNLVSIAPVDCRTFSSSSGSAPELISSPTSSSSSSSSSSIPGKSCSSSSFPFSDSLKSSFVSSWSSCSFSFFSCFVTMSSGANFKAFFNARFARRRANSFAMINPSLRSSCHSFSISCMASP